MVVEPLHDRRCNDWIAASVEPKFNKIVGSFFTGDPIGRSFERVIDGKLFQKIERCRTLFNLYARQTANANARVSRPRIWQKRNLRTRQEIETEFVEILIDENLGTLLRGNRLLDTVRKHLSICEIGSHVDVSRRDEAVGEIVNALNIKARYALIRMSCICLMP